MNKGSNFKKTKVMTFYSDSYKCNFIKKKKPCVDLFCLKHEQYIGNMLIRVSLLWLFLHYMYYH